VNPKLKLLYICTHNRCRSVLSEAITNKIAGDVIDARSAGSQPAEEVHPLTLKYLQQTGYPTDGLRSQSWDEFEDFAPDLVITVCDSAAGEACPMYFGNSTKMHWGLADPSRIDGDATKKEQAFLDCIEEVASRAQKLRDLAASHPDTKTLPTALAAIGAQ